VRLRLDFAFAPQAPTELPPRCKPNGHRHLTPPEPAGQALLTPGHLRQSNGSRVTPEAGSIDAQPIDARGAHAGRFLPPAVRTLDDDRPRPATTLRTSHVSPLQTIVSFRELLPTDSEPPCESRAVSEFRRRVQGDETAPAVQDEGH
jgi:hypothetical protein